MRSLILDRVARGILPVSALFAIYLLLRGHDAPGGGFIAGLVTSVAVILEALAFGAARTEAALSRSLRPAAWLGLAVAAASGLWGTLRGRGYLAHAHLEIDLGAGLSAHLSTTLLFDLGVYLVVIGVTATTLVLLARGVES